MHEFVKRVVITVIGEVYQKDIKIDSFFEIFVEIHIFLVHNNFMNKSKRGFASMSVSKRSAIAKSGGIAAHKQGRAHTYTHDEAVAAGRKGGKAKKKKITSLF